MQKELLPPIPQRDHSLRPRHEEDRTASKGDLTTALWQMRASSWDWNNMANILRRVCGGFSRKRTTRHGSTGSESNEE